MAKAPAWIVTFSRRITASKPLSECFGGSEDANDHEHDQGTGDHQQADRDGGLDSADGEFEEYGGGQHLGANARSAGEDQDPAELAERARPGEGGGGEHA